MSEIPQWAKDKAQEFTNERWPSQRVEAEDLAALLVEVGNQRAAETLVRCCVCENVEAPRPDCECVICSKRKVLAEVRRVVEEVLEDRWPADVFTPPPKGQHGSTVDACSAAALRAVIPGLRDEILSRLDKL